MTPCVSRSCVTGEACSQSLQITWCPLCVIKLDVSGFFSHIVIVLGDVLSHSRLTRISLIRWSYVLLCCISALTCNGTIRTSTVPDPDWYLAQFLLETRL